MLIIGAGHGGAQAAIALRQSGFGGSIAIAGAEPHPPYERPPLSKDYLAGEKDFERLLIRPPQFWADRGVVLLPGRRVVAVNAASRRATFSDGEGLSYGKMIWAAGGEARTLSCEGVERREVHSIRTRADVDRLRPQLPDVRRVAVIGGGYIGLEAAAVLVRLGKEIVVLEAMDRVLSRVAGPPVSRFYEAEHRAHGVEIRTAVAVERIEAEEARLVGVRLSGGELAPADMVIVGVGVAPAVGPLVLAGAEASDGVHVDEFCRTSLPDIFAVGDCAAHENVFAGGSRVRLESVQNAHDQATVAAKAIAGRPTPYRAIPWFWSNQYDLRLQTVGLSLGHDDLVVRGDPAERSFSVVYLKDGRVIALDCINAVKDYVQGRALVMDGTAAPKSLLGDPAFALKDIRTNGV